MGAGIIPTGKKINRNYRFGKLVANFLAKREVAFVRQVRWKRGIIRPYGKCRKDFFIGGTYENYIKRW